MAAKVNAKGLLCQDLIQCVGRALTLGHSECNLGFADAILDLEEFFLEIEWLHHLNDLLLKLLVLSTRNGQGAGVTEGEMQLLLLCHLLSCHLYEFMIMRS